jgi:hypothetical protein
MKLDAAGALAAAQSDDNKARLRAKTEQALAWAKRGF